MSIFGVQNLPSYGIYRYFNTLTFGGLMMNYLLYRGMGAGSVGIWRGISSAIGLIGTVVYQVASQRYTLMTTGMWSILFQFVCISFSMVSMFIQDYTLSMSLLILGVCTSRIGLYVFKITVTQLMQLYTPDGIRGSIGGTQNSLNAFFQLSQFALCLIYTNPKDFVVVVAAGYLAVAVAAVLYAFGIYFRPTNYWSTIIS
jgi:solute carrier family 40 (iron-regulated transporter), member 1